MKKLLLVLLMGLLSATLGVTQAAANHEDDGEGLPPVVWILDEQCAILQDDGTYDETFQCDVELFGVIENADGSLTGVGFITRDGVRYRCTELVSGLWSCSRVEEPLDDGDSSYDSNQLCWNGRTDVFRDCEVSAVLGDGQGGRTGVTDTTTPQPRWCVENQYAYVWDCIPMFPYVDAWTNGTGSDLNISATVPCYVHGCPIEKVSAGWDGGGSYGGDVSTNAPAGGISTSWTVDGGYTYYAYAKVHYSARVSNVLPFYYPIYTYSNEVLVG